MSLLTPTSIRDIVPNKTGLCGNCRGTVILPEKNVDIDPDLPGDLKRRLTAWLKDFRYKPFHVLRVSYEPPRNLVYFSLEIPTVDPMSRLPGRISFSEARNAQGLMDERQTRDDFYRWLMYFIQGWEKHEAQEWFCLGDEQPFYPDHGDGKKGRLVR